MNDLAGHLSEYKVEALNLRNEAVVLGVFLVPFLRKRVVLDPRIAHLRAILRLLLVLLVHQADKVSKLSSIFELVHLLPGHPLDLVVLLVALFLDLLCSRF